MYIFRKHLKALWIRILAWCLFHTHSGWYVYSSDMTSIFVLLVQLIFWLKVVSLCPCHQRADCVCQRGMDSHGIAGLRSTTSWLSRHCLVFFPHQPLWLCLHIGWRCLIEFIAIPWIVFFITHKVCHCSSCLTRSRHEAAVPSACCWPWQQFISRASPGVLHDLWASCGH